METEKLPGSIALQWIRAIHLLHDSSRSDNRTHSVPDRIVSVSQPFVRPIVRGKVGKPVEFGTKLDISVVDGWTRLECCSFDAYNEAGNLREMAERFRVREGHYPSRILADKIYRNRENLSYCKAHGIRLSGPALGVLRRVKPETRLRTIGMSASAWKWSADSVWRSENVAWGWLPQSCGRLRPI